MLPFGEGKWNAKARMNVIVVDPRSKKEPTRISSCLPFLILLLRFSALIERTREDKTSGFNYLFDLIWFYVFL